MKLYNVARGMKFRLAGGIGQAYKLGSIDGMYSWSIGEEDGKTYHFGASTEVNLVDERRKKKRDPLEDHTLRGTELDTTEELTDGNV